jgi:hypothetical protein
MNEDAGEWNKHGSKRNQTSKQIHMYNDIITQSPRPSETRCGDTTS